MQDVIQQIYDMKPSHVFTIADLQYSCNKTKIYRILKELKKNNVIDRSFRGIYYKVELSEFLGGRRLPPDIRDVVYKIAEMNKEVLQQHGALATNHFRISTQVPLTYVFYTSGYSREITVHGSRIKFIHTDNKKLLQYPGEKVGGAIACLYYLGKDLVDDKVLDKIKISIGEVNFQILAAAHLDKWIQNKIESYLHKS